MSRGEIKTAVGTFFAFILSPPGWIPAWATLALIAVFGWRIQVATLDGSLALDRIAAAQATYTTTVEMYKATLTVWLGYRGIGGLVEAIQSVMALRAARKSDPSETKGE